LGVQDLVIWGHEHDSHILPQQGTNRFSVIQPGSSVATSLSEGEALVKHIALLEIRPGEYNVHPRRLQCVRPFQFASIAQSKHADLCKIHSNSSDGSIELSKLLRELVTGMVDKANAETDALPPHLRPPKELQLPLIRLRVEHTTLPVLPNPQFGSQ
jgi:double-strand break repair protein MRE11